MKKLIVLVLAFVYVAGLGVTVNGGVQQLAKYPTSEPLVMSEFNKAVLTGALTLDGLEYLSYGEKALNGPKLAVTANYGGQKTANVNVLEPKASDAYLQYGHMPMQGVLTVQYQ